MICSEDTTAYRLGGKNRDRHAGYPICLPSRLFGETSASVDKVGAKLFETRSQFFACAQSNSWLAYSVAKAKDINQKTNGEMIATDIIQRKTDGFRRLGFHENLD